MSRIAVIRTSPHKTGNTNLLADSYIKGAKDAGHEIEDIYISNCRIGYCKGCYGTESTVACTRTGKCWQDDDLNMLLEKIRDCDVLVFATPIYFYSVSGQMKVFLDRTVPLYGKSYHFRDIYLIAASESGSNSAMDGAIKCLEGWMACFPGTKLKGVVYGTGALAPGEIRQNSHALEEAEKMGRLS